MTEKKGHISASSMPSPPLRDWQLPAGVPRGSWEYAQSEQIAGEYDADLADSPLFAFDLQVLKRHLTRPGRIVDLGCGTGRLLVPFARLGFPGLAVDISRRMLSIVRRKASDEGLPIDCLLANVVELDCLRDQVADYCLCMFSTLGMIRGRDQRQRVLQHARRILKPGGLFVVHVHNRWSNLYVSEGRRWLLRNAAASLVSRRVEAGDKRFPFRDVPQMFLHLFTRRELSRALQRTGFDILEIVAVHPNQPRALHYPWLLGRLRAGGWIAVCRRDGS